MPVTLCPYETPFFNLTTPWLVFELHVLPLCLCTLPREPGKGETEKISFDAPAVQAEIAFLYIMHKESAVHKRVQLVQPRQSPICLPSESLYCTGPIGQPCSPRVFSFRCFASVVFSCLRVLFISDNLWLCSARVATSFAVFSFHRLKSV